MRRLVQQETVHLFGFILRKESITGLYMIMIDEITIFLINKRSVSTTTTTITNVESDDI